MGLKPVGNSVPGLFLAHFLAAASRKLGWALGLAAFSMLNIGLHEEIWPHTPQALGSFIVLAVGSGVAVPFLLGRAVREAAVVADGRLLRLCCHLASWALYGLGFFLLVFLGVALLLIK